jgi:hypothetical protein
MDRIFFPDKIFIQWRTVLPGNMVPEITESGRNNLKLKHRLAKTKAALIKQEAREGGRGKGHEKSGVEKICFFFFGELKNKRRVLFKWSR